MKGKERKVETFPLQALNLRARRTPGEEFVVLRAVPGWVIEGLYFSVLPLLRLRLLVAHFDCHSLSSQAPTDYRGHRRLGVLDVYVDAAHAANHAVREELHWRKNLANASLRGCLQLHLGIGSSSCRQRGKAVKRQASDIRIRPLRKS